MNKIELEIEKAKRRDRAAVKYALHKLWKTPEWKSTSPDAQLQMKKDSADQITHKR